MKKFFLTSLAIFLTVVTVVITIAVITTPKKIKSYSDEELRKLAIDKNHKALPASFEELLRLVDDGKNPMTWDKITLGEELFFDKGLSKTKNTSCATCHSFDRDLKNRGAMLDKLTNKESKASDCAACHLQDQSGVDRFTFAQGDSGAMHPYLLNTQSILNVGFAKHFTWSGEVQSIREQAKNSFEAYYKMNIKPDELMLRLNESEKYRDMFAKAFADGITLNNTASAIEAYVKTLVTRAPYDRFLEGDDTAIGEQAKRGLANFINFGCKGCHNGLTFGGNTIQRFPLREFAQVYDVRANIELFPQPRRIDKEFPFENDGGFLGKDKEHLFRVPILRNVTKTSPYFHNGGVAKIREAVDIMARHQLGRHLSNMQIDEIVAFLRSLEGEIIDFRGGTK